LASSINPMHTNFIAYLQSLSVAWLHCVMLVDKSGRLAIVRIDNLENKQKFSLNTTNFTFPKRSLGRGSPR
jgi:hypothetical protein